jgi:hypothetical protein
MSVLLNPTCPTGCDTGLPAVDFDVCAPELHYGEVAKLYIAAADADDFANVEDLAEWTTRLSESVCVRGDEVRDLTVLGELPEPEQTEIAISGDRTAVGFKQFTLNFEVDETNDTNYNWLLTLECNMTFKFWYETADGMLYGGNEGITGTIRANQVIQRERTDLVKFIGTAKWKSQFSPLRAVSPMA